MKLAKRIGLIALATLLVSALSSCDGIITATLDWLSAPYGYVQDADGVAVANASVSVYRTSVATTNLVQTAATTSTTGFFSLTNPVDTKGGKYFIVVTPPSTSDLVFDTLEVEVPDTTYLFNIGTVKAVSITAPKGFVKDASGAAVAGASVEIYKGSVATANLLEAAVTTSATGAFTLTKRLSAVDTATDYIVVVTPASGSTLTYENTTISVAAKEILQDVGVIKPSAKYAITGKVVNVRVETQTSNIPTAGTVEARKFGATTVTATGTLASDGTYSIKGLESGEYFVTFKAAAGAATTYFGVPVSVNVAGGNRTDVGALVYTGLAADDVLIVATWNNTDYDVDSYAMVGAIGSASTVNYSTPSLTSGGNDVTLERDITSVKITAGAYPVETTLVKALGSGTLLRFYTKAYTTGKTITGLDDGANSVQPAGVTVYVMNQQDATTSVHYGTWYSPLNTAEKVVGFVEMKGNGDGTVTIGTLGWTNNTGSGETTAPRSIGTSLGQTVSIIE